MFFQSLDDHVFDSDFFVYLSLEVFEPDNFIMVFFIACNLIRFSALIKNLYFLTMRIDQIC